MKGGVQHAPKQKSFVSVSGRIVNLSGDATDIMDIEDDDDDEMEIGDQEEMEERIKTTGGSR